MTAFLEQYVWVGAALCVILALADAWTTREVISKGKGREGNWIPAKLVAKFGLTKYLIVSRLVVVAALWFEPMTGWTLSILFAAVVVNNYQNMK